MIKLNAAVGIARCPTTGKIYGVRVEERDSKWFATWAFPIKPDVAKREGYVENDFPSDIQYDSAYLGCPYCKKRENLANASKKAARIVFIIDTTGSMTSFIDSVKNRVIAFSDRIKEKKVACSLGLIGFGDLLIHEKPTVYSFTDDIPKFKNQVARIPRTSGGDEPESSLDAVETALDLIKSLDQNQNKKSIFVLITDAPPHVPTVTGMSTNDICSALMENNVMTYVLSQKNRNCVDAYTPLTKATNGKYYNINDDFYDILDDMATNIVKFMYQY